MGARLLKIAVVYFVIGIAFGMYASISTDFRFTGVHAHVNLLGWASLALAGIIYHLFPKAANHVLGKAHFWLHNIGLPVMMLCLFLMIYLNDLAYEMGIAIGASLTSLGVLAFLVNVFMNVSASTDAKVDASKSSSM